MAAVTLAVWIKCGGTSDVITETARIVDDTFRAKTNAINSSRFNKEEGALDT